MHEIHPLYFCIVNTSLTTYRIEEVFRDRGPHWRAGNYLSLAPLTPDCSYLSWIRWVQRWFDVRPLHTMISIYVLVIYPIKVALASDIF